MNSSAANILTYRVTGREEGQRIETVLAQSLNFSRSQIRRLKKGKFVFVNGEFALLLRRVQVGDEITVYLPVDEEMNMEPEDIPLDIRYEDDSILVVNKPAGMLVHPVNCESTGTLANAVVYHWLKQGRPARFRAVSRLDRDTSGLILVGKNQHVQSLLVKQLKEKVIVREYMAITEGRIDAARGTVSLPIGRKTGSIVHRAVSSVGKTATTHYIVLQNLKGAQLLRLKLDTGRTHQIRVHFSYMGHPLLGDDLYGGKTGIISRQALHAAELRLYHPLSTKLLEIKCELPRDMQEVFKLYCCTEASVKLADY